MRKYISKVSNPLVQIILIITTSLIIIISTYLYTNKFRNNDPEPNIISLEDPRVKKLLEKSSPIEVGFYIRGFYKFDILNNDFLIRAVVWFIYDPKKISKEIIEQFSFFRAETNEIHVYDKDETNFGDNKKLLRFFVTLKSSSNLNFSSFPLDDHRIYFILNNKFIPLEKGYFKIDPNNFKFEGDMLTPGWDSLNKGLKTGFAEFVLDDKDPSKTIIFPRIIFYIDYKNNNIKDVVIIFLPLFMTLFIVAFFFSIEYAARKDLITAIMGTAIPSIIAYRFVIETASPKVSYFMFADYIFALFVVMAFIIFILNFYIDRIKKFREVVILGFYLILIIMWNYYLFATGGL